MPKGGADRFRRLDYGINRQKMKIKKNSRRFFAVLLLCVFCYSFCLPAGAEENGLMGGQSNIVNGGFEDPDLKSENPKSNWINITKDMVSGWETTSTDGKIEFGWMLNGASAHMVPTTITEIIGEGASDGVQFAEAVSDETGSLYQSLSLNAGYYYNWTVHHRGREGVDTLALLITDDTHIDYVKSSASGSDHFYQIINWMKENGVTAPEAGNTAAYTVYTTELKESNSFADSTTGSYFSFAPDDEHTVKFEIQLMSTDKTSWGEYTGTYLSEIEKDILFVLTPFYSSYSKDQKTAGNLIDNCSFSDSHGNNLLVNAGFDDVKITAPYQYLNASNASSPKAGIGWCTTASTYHVEIGNLEQGNAYNIDVIRNTTVFNAPSIREGNQFVELNATQESSLYQIVNTEPGKMYRWSLSHRGRSGLDTMALIIGPGQPYAPVKTTAAARDQLMQISDWLHSQTDMAWDIPEQGCSEKITLYTPKFNSTGGWELSSNLFSWEKDSTHTEEWSVWIISSLNDTWHDYGELDSEAAYNYEYIVPDEHHQSIFGFVSVNSSMASGVKNSTYGNLLDNISFKEYYYININNATNSGGSNLYIVNDDGTFLFESANAGWAFAGSDISVHLQTGDRKIIGAYIGGAFVTIDDWEYNEETGEYIYHLENVSSSMQIDLTYVANTVVYDSRNNYEYQYDGIDGGCEFSLGPSFPEYISHAPEFDDGWEFIGWKYISTADSNVYMLDAAHKVVFVENSTDILLSSFAIYRILSGGETELVVADIPYDEGITFVAEWRYRQRVISKTFNRSSSEYDISTEGGHAKITVISGEASDKSDYSVDLVPVGEELYSSNGTYINVSAHKTAGYTFNGWYDKSGNLVSNSISYTYKVDAGKDVELYAYFEPVGYNILVNCRVEGDTDSARYFAINCSFSNLRENKVYTITGLSDNNITVNGEKVTNPSRIKADESGNAAVTVYMKHGDSADFVFLPENCIYSVSSDDYSDYGYNVRGEACDQVLSEEATVNLIYYHVKQSVLIEAGKHYAGIVSGLNPDEISITWDSSYTFDVTTQYNPKIFTGLNVSLCFFDSAGTATEFAAGTRILMIDLTDANTPRYYSYVVPDSSHPIYTIRLDEQFTELGSSNLYERNETGDGTIIERLVFLVDYVGTENPAQSGKISLVYDDANNELEKVIKPVKKIVNTGADATQLNGTVVSEGCLANIGPFTLNITVNSSTPTVNTAYEDDMYAIKLSFDGGFPIGSYADVDGIRYYSNNGCIIVSPLSSGEFTLDLYSPLPIALTDGKATLTAILLPAASSSVPRLDAKSTTVRFNCFDARECAIDADTSDKVLTPGYIYGTEITLRYEAINGVRLTVSRKDGDGSYSVVVRDQNISLPADNSPFTVDLGNGFDAVSGETYILSFVGYVDSSPVCSDVCCVVISY